MESSLQQRTAENTEASSTLWQRENIVLICVLKKRTSCKDIELKNVLLKFVFKNRMTYGKLQNRIFIR